MSFKPRSPPPDKVLARRGRSRLRNAASGQNRRHRPWSCQLSVAEETGTLEAARGPNCAHGVTATVGMRSATLAGSAGIQITWRTARTLWEHLPCGVLRGDDELPAPSRGGITSGGDGMIRAGLRTPGT